MNHLSVQNLNKLVIFQMLSLFFFSSAIGQNTQGQFKYVVGHSTFIFLGTITHMDSSNVNASIHRKKAIVRVDEILDGSDFDAKLKGEEITVVFTSNATHQQGDKQVFYTVGWSYGKTVGVIEVKNNLSVKFSPVLQQKIMEARNEIADDSLKVSLKRSVLVVHCVVRTIDDTVYSSIFQRSEHNPRLRRVTMEVKETLKGKAKKDSISVYYASTYDPLWIDAPKLTQGMDAIFIFNRGQATPFLNLPGYTLLDSKNVQSLNQREKIKKLLKNL